jgi:hypothetical protein
VQAVDDVGGQTETNWSPEYAYVHRDTVDASPAVAGSVVTDTTWAWVAPDGVAQASSTCRPEAAVTRPISFPLYVNVSVRPEASAIDVIPYAPDPTACVNP